MSAAPQPPAAGSQFMLPACMFEDRCMFTAPCTPAEVIDNTVPKMNRVPGQQVFRARFSGEGGGRGRKPRAGQGRAGRCVERSGLLGSAPVLGCDHRWACQPPLRPAD